MNETISIIVPIYKVELFLSQCIESIIRQTYQNLEIILVNDGSPDGCPQICDEYAKKDKRIKVIHKQNEGVAVARNIGIETATGDYIGHVDSDDYIHPAMYETMLQILQKTAADIVYCNRYDVYDEQHINELTMKQGADIQVIILNNIDALKALMRDQRGQVIVPWAKLYRKDIFDGVQYPKGEVNEDSFITWKLLYKSSKIAYADVKFYYHRIRENSTMQTFNLKRMRVLDAYQEITDCFKEEGINELFIIAARMYLHTIAHLYYRAKKAKMNTQLLEEIKERFYFEHRRLSIIKDISFGRHRLLVTLFFINPNLCCLGLKIKFWLKRQQSGYRDYPQKGKGVGGEKIH